MEAYRVMQSAHGALLSALDGLNLDHAISDHKVNKKWNLKQVLAHLAAHEHLLEEALSAQLTDAVITPYIYAYRAQGPDKFAQSNIQVRQDQPVQEILAELNSSHEHALQTLYLFTPKMLELRGTVPWYKDGLSIGEFIKLVGHDHKLQHAGQIQKFKEFFDKVDHIPTK